MKKRFKNTLKNNSHVLFCISDPDYGLLNLEPRKEKDINFSEDVVLLSDESSKPKIRKITLCPTFLISRWNILADIIALVDDFTKKNESATEKDLEINIINVLNKHNFDKETISLLVSQALEVKKVETTIAMPYAYNKEVQKLHTIVSLLGQEALKREQQWKEVNADAIAKLRSMYNGLPELSWQEFLKNIEIAKTCLKRLKKNKKFSDEFNKKLGTSRSQRFQAKYAKLSLYPKFRKLVTSCINEYVLEECLFEVWLQLCAKTNFDAQIHDGSLGTAIKYVIDNSATSTSSEIKIPFIEICNCKKKSYNDTGQVLPTDKNSQQDQQGNDLQLVFRKALYSFFAGRVSSDDQLFTREDTDNSCFKFIDNTQEWKCGFKITIDDDLPKVNIMMRLKNDLLSRKRAIKENDSGIDYTLYDRNYQDGKNKIHCIIKILEKDVAKKKLLFLKAIDLLIAELDIYLEEKIPNINIKKQTKDGDSTDVKSPHSHHSL